MCRKGSLYMYHCSPIHIGKYLICIERLGESKGKEGLHVRNDGKEVKGGEDS